MALIKCEECGNEISDKAKVCPKCGVNTKNKQIDKKKLWKLLIAVLIIGITIVLIVQIKMFNSGKGQYSKDVINILKNYKNGNMVETNAKKELYTISEMVNEQYRENKESETVTEWLLLKYEINDIIQDLDNGELDRAKIEKYIDRLKDIEKSYDI